MTLEGANILKENENNTIYTMNSVQTGQYCVVIPNNTDNIKMLVDLNMKNSFNSIANNTIDNYMILIFHQNSLVNLPLMVLVFLQILFVIYFPWLAYPLNIPDIVFSL